MADEQTLLDKPVEVKGLPDMMPTDAYASTVLKKIEDDFLGMIMSHEHEHHFGKRSDGDHR